MSEPKYLTLARTHIGLKELSGKNDHPLLLKWWISLGGKWLYRQAWCGLFVAHCLKTYNHPIPKHYYRAKSFLDWGVPIANPCVGAIVIFDRKGGGHVGFCVGVQNSSLSSKYSNGQLLCLGGNQSNEVSIVPFDRNRVLGYRIPQHFTGDLKDLPVITSQAAISTNEA